MKIIDARTNEALSVDEGPIDWWPYGGNAPYKWEARRTHNLGGVEVGFTNLGMTVYVSGTLLIEGEPAMKFDTPEEAKKFAEATYELRADGGG